MNEPIGRRGIAQSGAVAADRLADRRDRLVLADDDLLQLLLHADELLALLLLDLGHRDAGHVGDHPADLLALDRGLGLLAALGPGPAFVGQLRAQFLLLVAELGGLLELLVLDRRFLLAGRLVDLLLEFAQVLRHRAAEQSRPAAGLVDHVDGLVRQAAAADVADREVDRGANGLVAVLDPVVRLVLVAQAEEDLDGLLLARRVDHHRLEAPLEGAVLLDELAVLVERGGADALDLAAGERRLEHVARVDRALGPAGPDDGVQLVDEEDDVLVLADLVHDRLQAFLELPAILGPGHHAGQVEGDDLLAVEERRRAVVDDPLREALGDGRLADARLADQHGVVLLAPRQDLDHAIDLTISADRRVERWSRASCVRFRPNWSRTGVSFFFLEASPASPGAPFALLPSSFMISTHLLVVGAQVLQDARGHPLALADQGEQEVLGTHVVVVVHAGLVDRELQHALGSGRERNLADGQRPALGRDHVLHRLLDLVEVDPETLQGLRGDSFALTNDAEQEMLGPDVVVLHPAGLVAGQEEHLANPFREAVVHHSSFLSSARPSCSRTKRARASSRSGASMA